jgi:hypothetical protein
MVISLRTAAFHLCQLSLNGDRVTRVQIPENSTPPLCSLRFLLFLTELFRQRGAPEASFAFDALEIA